MSGSEAMLPRGELFERCLAPDREPPPAVRAAIDAMVDFDAGARTGGWGPFLDRLADDVSLTVPAPGFAERGVLHGREAASEVFAYHDGVGGLGWRVRTLSWAGNEVFFEAVVREDGDTPPVSMLLLVAFVVRDGRIARMREYAVHTGEDGHGWGADDVASRSFDYRDAERGETT